MKNAKNFIIFTFLLTFAGVCISAQSIQFTNELKGYEFFAKGKLKDLQLTISSKDDVKKIFGADCKDKCDYDTNWSIRFQYYEDIWIKESRNEKNEKLRYLLDSKYLGKLRLIEIRPKKAISFTDASFPDTFEKLLTTYTIDTRSGKSKMVVNDAFQHFNGLTYEVYSRTNYDDIKNKKATSLNSGDLVLIRYDVTKELEKNLFILRN